LEVVRLRLGDVVEASRYSALLGALWREVEGRKARWCDEARWGDEVCRRWLEGRVGAEALEVAVGVARRVVGSETRRVAGVEFEMVWCPAGEFWMKGHHDERPRHRVKLTRGFWLGQTQVTQVLWEEVMGENPSHFKGAQRPVEQVSWFDCVRFCNRLSEREGLVAAYQIGEGDRPEVTLNVRAAGYRLPTEAEWEYAAKAGTELKYAGSNSMDAVAWHNGNSGGQTHPVGEKQANAWGLYDMTGNVWEWCSDGWTDNYRARQQGVSDPGDNSPGAGRRVFRGGSWGSDAVICHVACRGRNTPGGRSQNLGLRLSRSLE